MNTVHLIETDEDLEGEPQKRAPKANHRPPPKTAKKMVRDSMAEFMFDYGDPLRALRLYHWREFVRYRKLDESTANTDRHKAGFRKEASLHNKAVLALNETFPSGDTAEKDDA